MTDVFLSYAREDRLAVERLAAALEAAGLPVWWDRNLTGGTDFSRELEKRLNEAPAILVVWSRASVESMWVGDEAAIGREKGNLVPVSIEAVAPKIGFRGLHTIDLSGWRGDPAADSFLDLVRALKSRLSPEALPVPAATRRSGWASLRPRSVMMMAAAFVLVTIGVVVAVSRPWAARPPAATQDPPRDAQPAAAISAASIAVLPFADMSEKKDQEYFADGMAEEILNVLTRVDGLKVASRTSSFAFKAQPNASTPAIAHDLGVRHLLEGSVRKSGDTVRITVQLIDTAQDAHLWSETFDRPLTAKNLFAIQDEVARSVVAALRGKIGAKVGDAAKAPARTDNVDAYGLFLKARVLFNARRDLNAADHLLEDALKLDSRFADALAIRAAVREFGGQYGADFGDFDSARERGRAFAREAVAIDPGNSLAVAVTGLYDLRDHLRGRPAAPYSAILSNLDRALALDPKNSNAVHWKGFSLFYLGDYAAALATHRHCIDIDTTLSACRVAFVGELLALGRKQEAAAAMSAAASAGVITPSVMSLIEIAELGQREAFPFVGQSVPDLKGWQDFNGLYDAMTRPGDHRAIAAKLQALLDANRAWLDSYLLLNAIGDYERPILNSSVFWTGVMGPYRQSPEFKRHARASGLYDYWRARGFPPQCRALGSDDFACN